MSKIRNGFVSNSSSSSFIIGCEKLPTTFGESLDVFFGDKQNEVSPLIAQHLFQTLKNYTLDFDKLMEIAKKPIQCCYSPFTSENDNNSHEESFLDELWKDFSYKEQREGHPYGSWCSWIKSPYEQYIEENNKEPESIDGKWNRKNYEEEQRLSVEWFNKEEIRQKWIDYVEKETKELRKYPVHMEVEVEDDSSLGAEIEKEFSWDYYFPAVMRFSHH